MALSPNLCIRLIPLRRDAFPMLYIADPACLHIRRKALIVKSKNIQYPATRNQDQPMLAMVSFATAYIGCKTLCNYRIIS